MIRRAPFNLQITEHTFQDKVISYARQFGWRVSAMHKSQDIWWGCDVGFPDLTMVRGERLIFAELKAMGGRLGKGQPEWIESLKRTGAEVYLWRPSDEATVIKTLSSARGVSA